MYNGQDTAEALRLSEEVKMARSLSNDVLIEEIARRIYGVKDEEKNDGKHHILNGGS